MSPVRAKSPLVKNCCCTRDKQINAHRVWTYSATQQMLHKLTLRVTDQKDSLFCNREDFTILLEPLIKLHISESPSILERPW